MNQGKKQNLSPNKFEDIVWNDRQLPLFEPDFVQFF